MRTRGTLGTLWWAPLAAVLGGIATPALAVDAGKGGTATVSAIADTQARALQQGKIHAGSLDWTCSGTRCKTTAQAAALAGPVVACQALAREIGRIRSFKVGARTLIGSELKLCNDLRPTAAAASPPPPAPASGPVEFRTATVRYVGHGPVEFTTAPVRYVGHGPVEFTTATVRYVGRSSP